MTERYGRNQKRAARQRIAELEQLLRHEEYAAAALARRLASAKEEAFKDYARQHDLIKEAVTHIGHEMGRALGPKLAPIAEKILASDRRSSRLPMSPVAFDLSARFDEVQKATVIRGEIPALNYNIALWP